MPRRREGGEGDMQAGPPTSVRHRDDCWPHTDPNRKFLRNIERMQRLGISSVAGVLDLCTQSPGFHPQEQMH